MAEDLTQFINTMDRTMEQGRAAVTATDDPVRKVKNQQVANSVDAQSSIALSDLVALGETQKLVQQKKAAQDATITQIENTQMKYQQTAQARMAAADQEAMNSKQLRQSLNASYDTALQDYAQEVQGANFSFFRNPLTYIRDQYRVGYKTERLRELAQAIDGTTSRIQSTYRQAAEDLQRLRTGSMATELMAITQKHRREVATLDDSLLIAQQKLQTNEFVRNKTTDILNTTLQLTSDPRGASGAQLDALNVQKAKLMYVMSSPTGTLEGFDPDNSEQVQALVASVDGRTQEFRDKFYQQLPYFTVMDTTGESKGLVQLLQFNAANKDLGNFYSLLSNSNHPISRPLKEMLDGVTNDLISQEYQKLEAEYVAGLEENSPDLAAQVKVSGVDKNTRAQLMEQASTAVVNSRGDQIMQTFFNGVGQAVSTRAKSNPAMLFDFAPEDVASLVIQDLPANFSQESAARVEKALMSESFQNIKYEAAKLQAMKDANSNLPLLGKTGSYAQATLDALRAEGVPEAEIPAVLASFFKRGILASMMDEPEIGRQIKSLAEFGLDDDVPMDVTILEPETIFFGLIDTRGGKQFDAIRNKKANLTDPAGAANAIAALDRFAHMRESGLAAPVGAGILSAASLQGMPTNAPPVTKEQRVPRDAEAVQRANLEFRFKSIARKLESGQYSSEAEKTQLMRDMQEVQSQYDAMRAK